MRALLCFVSLSLLASRTDVASQIDALDVYAPETAPFQPNAALFLRLRNRDDRAHALVAAECAAAKAIEIHTSSRDGGINRMRRIDALSIPPHGEAQLRGDGAHLMLLGIAHPLRRGDKLLIALAFEDGSRKSIEAQVRPIDQAR